MSFLGLMVVVAVLPTQCFIDVHMYNQPAIATQMLSNQLATAAAEMKIYLNQIKNMLTRRKESDTYLATVSRHRWSRKIMMKIDKIS